MLTSEQVQAFVEVMDSNPHRTICNVGAQVASSMFTGDMFQFPDWEPSQSLMESNKGTGHVFFIHEDRWLVDYWAWSLRIIPSPVLDLDDPKDRVFIKKYGSNWELVR